MIRRFVRILTLFAAVAAIAVVAGLAKPSPASAATTRTTNPVDLVNSFIPSIDSYWRAVFINYRQKYSSPKGFYWYGYTRSDGAHVIADCGNEQLPDLNAAYCPSDGNVYLGYVYLQQKIQNFGPYAAIGTLAHEWGHHVQTLLGWMTYAAQHKYYMGTELQADCYAGMYTRWAYAHGWITAEEVREAQNGRFASGDDQMGGQVLGKYTPGAHGTGAQRLAWFNYGFRTQNLLSCNGVYKALYGA
jgi:uncharacterized protein